MSTSIPSPEKERITAEGHAQIDEICDEFEAAWRRLQLPRMEGYLARSEPELRSSLLEELLRIDRHWRQQASDTGWMRSELNARFPEAAEAVDAIWAAGEGTPSLFSQQSSLGAFQQLERIGEGGFGIVFRAWDSRHRRTVALKLPRFGYELAGQNLDRFLREAKAAGSLDHPGIARVWDSGRIAGVTYIAYQFIDGENLKTRFPEVRQWTVARLARFVGQLAEAIHYAHAQGIVHRDIKPSNVLLSTDDRPVLTDFGLALAAGGEFTRSLAARVGTLDYMSPEQASGTSDRVDGRADLWSLGVLLYELLTGEKPFRGNSDIEILRAIVESSPRSPRSRAPRIPRDLELITMRCLEKRREDRLPSCQFLAEELRRVERREPIMSRRISFVERALRWCHRNPRPIATFAIILLATSFGAWSWGGWVYDTRQNENIVQQLQIEIEANHAQRRQLLEKLLTEENLSVSLTEEDLLFLKTRFLENSDLKKTAHAAVLLSRHGWFDEEHFPRGTQRRSRCLEILSQIVDRSEPWLEQDLREEIVAAHASLSAD